MEILKLGVQIIQKVSRAENIILLIVNFLIPEFPDNPQEGAEQGRQSDRVEISTKNAREHRGYFHWLMLDSCNTIKLIEIATLHLYMSTWAHGKLAYH